jgi:eukaryotic-like serine/threonine-protein kinase
MIGPYRLRGLLGVGGMGRVFLGLSAEGQLVAVKVVRTDLAADPQFRVRFRQEVAVARRVSGPFTAPVIDADADGPVPWLATAYVSGPSLTDAVAERGPLPTWSVLKLAAGLAEGLSVIHAAGVVHRDLKPSNVLLARDGPRVIDFGLSRASGASALTRTGPLVGSPGFMSPEQAEGREVGPPGDVFSLGAVLTFAATGEGPFGSGSALALVYRVIHCPPDLDQAPAEVQLLVRQCLAEDPGLRPTARELLTEVSRIRSMTGGHRAAAPGPVPLLSGRDPASPDLPLSLTAAQPAPSGPAPGGPVRHTDAQRWDWHPRGRGWRPLAAAAVIAALAAAAATAGVALASAHHASHPAQSQGHAASVPTSPAAFAPPSSAGPRASGPAATVRKRPAPVATPMRGGSPVVSFIQSASANPPAPQDTAPPRTQPPTRAASPPPSAAPTRSAALTPSADPTPTSGGY